MTENTALKYIPNEIGVLHDRGLVYRPVSRVQTYQPGTHPPCPIRSDYIAVQVFTDHGARWFGTKEAFIDSHLRMVIRVNMRDEVLAKWEDVKK